MHPISQTEQCSPSPLFPTSKHHFGLPPIFSNWARHLEFVIPTGAARFSLPRRIMAGRAAQRD
jgi:hypothetical protein